MPGAALLVVRAAQRAGAGLVTLGCLDEALSRVLPSASPETLYLELSGSRELFRGQLPGELREHRHDARLAGPGLGSGARTRELVECLVEDREFDGPLLLDADALNVAAGRLDLLATCATPLVLTPHPGEAGRLLGRDVPADGDGRFEVARSIARASGGICVLKGAGTVITDGERDAVNETGCAAMATAGTGDVLCGILGAYMCSLSGDFDLFAAARAAVWVHGRAGELAAEARGVRGTVASDLIEHLPLAQLEHQERSGA